MLSETINGIVGHVKHRPTAFLTQTEVELHLGTLSLWKGMIQAK